jgi:hypothetical protein
MPGWWQSIARWNSSPAKGSKRSNILRQETIE